MIYQLILSLYLDLSLFFKGSCLVGRRENEEEGEVGNLGEGNGEGGKGPFSLTVFGTKGRKEKKSHFN